MDQACIAPSFSNRHILKSCRLRRTAQDHLALHQTSEARQSIAEGLQFPDHPRVLTAANQVSRSIQDHESALDYAYRLCAKEPSNPVGFNRASQDLLVLGRAQEAKELMQEFQARNSTPQKH